MISPTWKKSWKNLKKLFVIILQSSQFSILFSRNPKFHSSDAGIRKIMILIRLEVTVTGHDIWWNYVEVTLKCHLHMSFYDLGEPYAKVPWNLKLCSIHVEWTQPRSSAFNCVHLRPIAFNSVYAGSGGFMRVHAGSCGVMRSHAGSCGSMRGNVNL